MNESDGDVTLTVGVRGGANRCNKSEWTVNYIVRNISAQCEQVHAHHTFVIMYAKLVKFLKTTMQLS